MNNLKDDGATARMVVAAHNDTHDGDFFLPQDNNGEYLECVDDADARHVFALDMKVPGSIPDPADPQHIEINGTHYWVFAHEDDEDGAIE